MLKTGMRAAVGRVAMPVIPSASSSLHRMQWRAAKVVIRLPTLGESVSEADIASLNKQVGDSVVVDESVITVDTEKTAVDVRSPSAGKVTALQVKKGDTVKVGTPLFEIDTDDSAPSSKSDKHDKPSSSSSASSSSPKQDKSSTEKKTSSPSSSSSPPSSSDKPATSTGSSAASSDSDHLGRVPSIKFRHGKANQDNGSDVAAHGSSGAKAVPPAHIQHQAPSSSSSSSSGKGGKTSVEVSFKDLPSNFRGTQFDEDAINLIEMGGAVDPPKPKTAGDKKKK